jgi:hypothetical protein
LARARRRGRRADGGRAARPAPYRASACCLTDVAPCSGRGMSFPRHNRVFRSCVPYFGGGDFAATRLAVPGTREGSGGLCECRSACVASGSRARH